ncbi:MAG: PAS domain S-box protein [Candidatus Eremiobacterota bacterium]
MKNLLNSSENNRTIENTLKETRHFAEKILATTPNFIYVYDLNKKCNIYTNHELMNFFGYTSEEVKIMSSNFFKTILHPEDIEKVTEYFKHMIDAPDGEIFSIEYRIKHSDGSWKWIYTRDTVFKRNSTGMVEQIIGTATDITDKKISEKNQELSLKVMELLNQPGEKLSVIGHIIGLIKKFTEVEAVGIRLKDDDEFPYYVTDGFHEHFIESEKYLCNRDSAGNIILNNEGNPVMDCLCGKILTGNINKSLPYYTEKGSFWCNNTSCFTEINSEEEEICTRKKCIKEGYSSIALIPLKSGNDTAGLLQLNSKRINCFTVEMIKLFEGIASSTGIALTRWKAQESLKETKDYLDKVINSVSDPIFVKDINHRLVMVNDAECSLLGYKREEIIGKTDYDFFPKEQSDIFWEKDDLVFNTGEENVNEEKLTNAYGDTRTIVTKKALYKDKKGQKYIVGITRDITDIKKAHEEKEKIEKQLQQAQKMESIGTLAGGIAHDFNNILGTIISYSELGLTTVSDEFSVRKSFEGIIRAGYRARDIIRQILTFSRQAEIELNPFSLRDIIKETLPLIRSSIPSTIKIKTIINTDGMILADHGQFSQILLNLCSNAMDAMTDHGGLLEISLSRLSINSEYTDLKPGDYIVLTVTDTGHGMDRDILERIFDPFFTTKDQTKGSGMGLSVVHGIVKNHGGTITVSSEVNKGSSLQILIPEFQKQVTEKEDSKESVTSEHVHILFIDDEEDLLFSQGQMLKFQGYDVTSTTSSMEAMEIFQKNPYDFDLIITDQTMPDMTGIEIVKNIFHIRPGIPVILCTGYSEQSIEDEAESIGIKCLLIKPVTAKNLIKTIRKVLEK